MASYYLELADSWKTSTWFGGRRVGYWHYIDPKRKLDLYKILFLIRMPNISVKNSIPKSCFLHSRPENLKKSTSKKKTREIKSITFTKIFLTKFHFCNFKMFKTAKNAISRNFFFNFLISRVSFVWTFFNFLAHCVPPEEKCEKSSTSWYSNFPGKLG